jgi:hypothetical protein
MGKIGKAAIIGGGIGTLLIGGGALFSSIAEPTFVPGQMPTCSSDFTKELYQDAFAQSPLAAQTGLKILEIGAIQDIGQGAGFAGTAAWQRLCTVQVFTNGGLHTSIFHTQFMNDAKDQIWLEIKSFQ